MKVQEFFELGMKRQIPRLKSPSDGLVLNIGAGSSEIDGAIPLDLPEYNANLGVIPYDDGSVDFIHAYHLLEHLDDPRVFLLDCQRVLRVGGVLNIVVPYGACHMAVQDITHRRLFNEDTWKTLFRNPYYDTSYGDGVEWCFAVHANFIMGVKGTNLALFTQLVRTEQGEEEWD